MSADDTPLVMPDFDAMFPAVYHAPMTVINDMSQSYFEHVVNSRNTQQDNESAIETVSEFANMYLNAPICENEYQILECYPRYVSSLAQRYTGDDEQFDEQLQDVCVNARLLYQFKCEMDNLAEISFIPISECDQPLTTRVSFATAFSNICRYELSESNQYFVDFTNQFSNIYVRYTNENDVEFRTLVEDMLEAAYCIRAFDIEMRNHVLLA
jgi:hypothetical protein